MKMLYQISRSHPRRHLITISFFISNINSSPTYLSLPAWRPGRYELTHFARNIYKITAENLNGKALMVEKVSKDKWEVVNDSNTAIKVTYQYYANQPDAGGSVADEHQLYINFINCLLYVENRLNEPCEVHFDLPENYDIACGLPKIQKHQLRAESYYHLVDSPMIASPNLQHLRYEIDNYTFHIWVNGEWQADPERFLPAFKAFSAAQIAAMEGFPCADYHFLFQILPYKFYHGVEHFNSTVIVLGPAEDMDSPELTESMLGVSSHELFHTWNIIRIRPKEMWPYRFNQENYFKTGYVAEGFTTYYGDLFLLRGRVFDSIMYFDTLNKSLKRHAENFGRFNLSLAESSYDLWLDGYTSGIPDRKVSIYIKGSLVAFMLDLTIRKQSGNKNGLDDLMRSLWKDFGSDNSGYSEQDVQAIAEKLAGCPLGHFFQHYIYGTKPIEEELARLLQFIGYKLEQKHSYIATESIFGFKAVQKGDSTIVSAIAPDSVADLILSKDDELLAIDGRKIINNLEKLVQGKREITVTLFRNHRLLNKKLSSDGKYHYHQLVINPDLDASEEAKVNFKNWAHTAW